MVADPGQRAGEPVGVADVADPVLGQEPAGVDLPAPVEHPQGQRAGDGEAQREVQQVGRQPLDRTGLAVAGPEGRQQVVAHQLHPRAPRLPLDRPQLRHRGRPQRGRQPVGCGAHAGCSAQRCAPRDGSTRMVRGGGQPRRANASATASAAGTRRSTSTSAMTQPPKPPPVMRAPESPGAEQRLLGEVERGDGHLVVVAQRGVGGRQQRPDVAGPPGLEQRHHVAHPLVLGDHVAHPAALRPRPGSRATARRAGRA